MTLTTTPTAAQLAAAVRQRAADPVSVHAFPDQRPAHVPAAALEALHDIADRPPRLDMDADFFSASAFRMRLEQGQNLVA